MGAEEHGNIRGFSPRGRPLLNLLENSARSQITARPASAARIRCYQAFPASTLAFGLLRQADRPLDARALDLARSRRPPPPSSFTDEDGKSGPVLRRTVGVRRESAGPSISPHEESRHGFVDCRYDPPVPPRLVQTFTFTSQLMTII